MDIRTILLSLMTLIVVGIVIIIIYELTQGGGILAPSPISPVKTSVELIGALHDGRDYLKIDKKLPLSQNEKDGIEFSYAFWIVVNDYDEGSEMPIVFVKGRPDLSLSSPAVSLRRGKNEIHILQDTYDKKKPGKISIHNLPAGKLLHIVITVHQTAMNVYVDGFLYKHVTLSALPLQNSEDVQVAEHGGWKGLIGTFIYYNYALTPDDVRNLSQQKPKRDPNDVPPYPPYFDSSWWISRH